MIVVFILLLILIIVLGFTKKPPGAGRPANDLLKTVTIDTAPPMEMSKCALCHKDLNAFNNPKLINFNHPVHFKRGIRCQSCHIEWPHQKSKLIKPTMDLCMNCHRLEHGNQGLAAPGDCSLCHPKDFNLVPKDHTDNFRKSSHSVVARAGKNQSCLNCHTGKFCRSCHISKGITEPAGAYTISPVLRQPKQRQWKKITLGSTPVIMSKCNTCHTNLQLWKNPKLINFNHPVHFKRGIRCRVCHTEWPHQPDKVVKPIMYACAQCHRLAHSNQGLAAPGDCNVCHPSTMKLKPDFHTLEFIGGGHKTLAKQDRGLCRTCHRQSFCDNCHQTEIPHRPGWRSEHGRVAASKAKKTTILFCFNCHQNNKNKPAYKSAPSCAKCHKASIYPHPRPWAPLHGKTAEAFGRRACATCHKLKLFCKACHKGITMPHKDDWLGKHFSFLRDRSVGLCLGCHRKEQCIQCHSTHNVHNSYTNYLFDNLKVGR